MTETSYILKSKLFDVDFIGRYKLVIKCLKTNLKLVVIDTLDNRCLYYENHKRDRHNEEPETMDAFWDGHPFLSAQYWKDVQVVTNQSTVSFIPKSYAKVEYYPHFLKLNGTKLTPKNIYSFEHKNLDLISIFNLEPVYETFFRVLAYPQAHLTFLHNSTIFLEHLSTLPASAKAHNIYLNISENLMTIVIFQNEKLFFVNSYTYCKPIDIVYFTNLLVEYFNLDSHAMEVTLWGDLDLNHKAFLKKHLPNFDFGSHHPDLKLQAQFNSLEPHKDFDMLV